MVDIDGEAVEDAGAIWQTIVIDQAKTVTVDRDGQRVRIDIPEEAIAQLLKSPDFATVRIPFVVGETVAGDPAAQAGLLAGDTLVSFNGESMRYFDQYRQAFETYASDTVTLGVMRDSAGITRLITLPVKVSEKGTIGVYPVSPASLLALSTHRYNFWQAIPAGIQRTGSEISSYAKQIKLMFTPKTEAYKSLGGVIAIGNIFPNYWSWEQFWRITAFLSVVLAVMNILPIPALDGGRLVFLLIEAVRKKRIAPEKEGMVHFIGFAALMALMVFVMYNDIMRLF